jgi:hypothetical protein
MPREIVNKSLDFTQVEPILVRPSGRNPDAAVAYQELNTEVGILNASIATRLDQADLVDLFETVTLTGGVTEERDGDDGTRYFFTVFEAPIARWAAANPVILELDLSEANPPYTKRGFYHDFQVPVPGTIRLTFESKIGPFPNDQYRVTVMAVPVPVVNAGAYPGFELIAANGWMTDFRDRVGAATFDPFVAQVVAVDGRPTLVFRNGNTMNEEYYNTHNYGEQETLAGVPQ